jgi:hypothetical protein
MAVIIPDSISAKWYVATELAHDAKAALEAEEGKPLSDDTLIGKILDRAKNDARLRNTAQLITLLLEEIYAELEGLGWGEGTRMNKVVWEELERVEDEARRRRFGDE